MHAKKRLVKPNNKMVGIEWESDIKENRKRKGRNRLEVQKEDFNKRIED